MATTDATSGGYTLKEEPLENLRPLKVRVIGAGYSGIYAAIRFVSRDVEVKTMADRFQDPREAEKRRSRGL